MNDINSQKSDEIDLIELFRALWAKKLWIVLSAFVCTAIAGVYAFTVKEQWTSNAILTMPRTTDLSNLLPIRAEYARIINDKEFSEDKLSTELYNQFKHFLLSNDLKRQFLQQSTWVKSYTQNMTEEKKKNYLEELVSKYLIVHSIDPKKKDLTELDKIGLKVSFSTETPVDAQSVLVEYIQFVNQYVLNQINEEFKLGFKLRLESLVFSQNQIKETLNEAKAIQIENLTNALSVAKKAGITDFSKSSNNFSVPEYMLGEGRLNISDSKLADGTYLFMLGERYLQAQLDIARSTEIVYPTNYYSIEREVAKLINLEPKLAEIGEVKVYSYLSSPDYPIMKDKPKKALILAIGFILGLICSTIVVLLGSFLKDTKKIS